MGTQTIKFRYEIAEEDKKSLIHKAIRQYNNCVHVAYNMLFDKTHEGLEKRKVQNILYKNSLI